MTAPAPNTLLPLPNDLYRAISRALLGEIFNHVVAVAAAWTAERDFTLHVYLDRAAHADDAEGLDIILTEIIADFSLDYFHSTAFQITATTQAVQHLMPTAVGCLPAQINPVLRIEPCLQTHKSGL